LTLMTTKTKLTASSEAILSEFRVRGGDCSICVLEDLHMSAKVFIANLDSLLHLGYLEKVHSDLPGLWFRLTKKGLSYCRSFKLAGL
jgi:hypothetical protein